MLTNNSLERLYSYFRNNTEALKNILSRIYKYYCIIFLSKGIDFILTFKHLHRH